MIIGFIAFAAAFGMLCAGFSASMGFSTAFSFLFYVVGGSIGFCVSVLYFYIRSSVKQAFVDKIARLRKSGL